MSVLQSSRLVPLHYRRRFRWRLADLNRPLRYSLGGIRPKQTTRQTLSPPVFAGQVRTQVLPEWYFTDDSPTTEMAGSQSPTYATQAEHMLNIKL